MVVYAAEFGTSFRLTRYGGKCQSFNDSLTKPPGSLGGLEALAARLCLVQHSLSPTTRPRRLVVFVEDHGVVAEGVSAWPSEVTGPMI
jgi:nicotinate-nucleotide--dimethylbenzimidazole phosphoribosyltransferase